MGQIFPGFWGRSHWWVRGLPTRVVPAQAIVHPLGDPGCLKAKRSSSGGASSSKRWIPSGKINSGDSKGLPPRPLRPFIRHPRGHYPVRHDYYQVENSPATQAILKVLAGG